MWKIVIAAFAISSVKTSVDIVINIDAGGTRNNNRHHFHGNDKMVYEKYAGYRAGATPNTHAACKLNSPSK